MSTKPPRYFTTQVTLNSSVFAYWDGIRRVYYPHLQLFEMIEDSLAFYAYIFARTSWKDKPSNWQFPHDAWQRLTGHNIVADNLSEAAESIGESTVSLRCSQLAAEQFLPRCYWVDPEVPFGVHKESPILKEWKRIPTVTPRITDAAKKFENSDLIQRELAIAPTSKVGSRERLLLTLSTQVVNSFAELVDHYDLSFHEGLLVVLSQVPRFYVMIGGHTPSFREDLVVRRMHCMEFVERAFRLLERSIVNQEKILMSAKVIAERVPLYRSGAKGNQSLADFLAGMEPRDAAWARFQDGRSVAKGSSIVWDEETLKNSGWF